MSHSLNKTLHPPRKRRESSFRPAIAAVIERRIAAQEPLAIRAIIAEAGGGSTDTVREELARAGVDAAARMLVGDRIRNYAEREASLRAQLQHVTSERDTLRQANVVLEQAVRTAAEPSKVLEQQVAEIDRRVRGAVEEMLRETARLRRARQKGTETVIVPDATLEARYQKLVHDHAVLVERFHRLRGLYFEATGEHFE